MQFHSMTMRQQNALVSDLVTKLERAERDLAILREAHKAHRHGLWGGGGTLGPTDERFANTLDARLDRVPTYLAQNPDVRVAAVSGTLTFPSGETAEVLTPAAQEAKCWAMIEHWHYRSAHRGAPSRTLVVEFLGPYERPFAGGLGYCVRLPNGHTTDIKPTRLDALAHAAQWCESELEK